MLAGFLAGAELQGCFLVKFPECFYEAGAAFVSGFMADLQDTEAGIAKKLGRLLSYGIHGHIVRWICDSTFENQLSASVHSEAAAYSAPEYWEQTPGDR